MASELLLSRFGKSRRGWGQKDKEGVTDEGVDTDPTSGSPSEHIRERREGPHSLARESQPHQQQKGTSHSHGPAGHVSTEASSGADTSGVAIIATSIPSATLIIEQGGSGHYGQHKDSHSHHQVRLGIILNCYWAVSSPKTIHLGWSFFLQL